MKWVVRYIPENKYYCSTDRLVSDPRFARKFTSEKLAKAFIRNFKLNREEVTAEPLEELRTELIDGVI